MKTKEKNIDEKICKVMKSISPQISERILKEILSGKSITDFKIIDSLNLVAFLCELEAAFNIKLDAQDVAIENFETIKKIKEMLQKKL